jgi:hypothetical protein
LKLAISIAELLSSYSFKEETWKEHTNRLKKKLIKEELLQIGLILLRVQMLKKN